MGCRSSQASNKNIFTNRAMRISDWFAAPRHPGNDVATAPSAAPSLLTWPCGRESPALARQVIRASKAGGGWPGT